MVLRLCAFLCLLAVAAAQSSISPLPTPASSTPAPASTPPVMMAPSSTPSPSPSPTPENSYTGNQASSERSNHFYCLGADATGFPLAQSGTSADNSETSTPYYWAIFLQFPVLSYLDSQRKRLLLYIIAQLVSSGGLTSFNYTDFCIANVYHYDVAEYDESVLINLYFGGITVINTPDLNNTVSIAEFNTAFKAGFAEDDPLIQPLLGRRALALDKALVALNDDMSRTESNQHPGFGNDPSKDPTLRAVVLGTYEGITDVSRARAEQQYDFLGNPDPINFSLEPGDIVFAIFGGIFLTIVGGLVILGFCIHPFFLA